MAQWPGIWTFGQIDHQLGDRDCVHGEVTLCTTLSSHFAMGWEPETPMPWKREISISSMIHSTQKDEATSIF